MILIIDTQYFENFTIIDTDFDSNKVNNHLVDAQEIQVYELLGKDLYDQLQLALAGTPTVDEQILIDKLKPFLLKATELNLIPFLNTPVTAKGTQERSGNNTTSASGTDKGLILDNVRAKIEVHALRIAKFLDENQAKYPNWRKGCKTNKPTFYSAIYGV